MRNPLFPLGGTEMEVLREVWSLGRASARDVHDRISARRRVAYTTVMTVMKNLAEKGYLRYDTEGTAYVYQAARPPEEVRASVLSGILDKVFGGSPQALVQALVQRETLTDDERAEIRRLIDGLDDDAPESDA
ncbi:MAG: BlaI/MecI/CopY family transcriptional regulator [Bacteroidota bacterium]